MKLMNGGEVRCDVCIGRDLSHVSIIDLLRRPALFPDAAALAVSTNAHGR